MDGHLALVTINYMENDWPDGYETYRDKLKSTIISGGVAFGAFNENGSLVGFATINHDFFGETAHYLLLDSMFVSRPYRGTGLGKKLFKHCSNKAYEWGADKLYLCAGSSEDIVLREFEIDNLDALYKLTLQPEIIDFLPDWKATKEQRKYWLINDYMKNNREFLHAVPNIHEEGLILGIILKETNEFIG